MRGELAALSIALIPLFILFMPAPRCWSSCSRSSSGPSACWPGPAPSSPSSAASPAALIAGIAVASFLPASSWLLMAVIGAPLGLLLLFVVVPVLAFLGVDRRGRLGRRLDPGPRRAAVVRSPSARTSRPWSAVVVAVAG
jgi:hypothetical protein